MALTRRLRERARSTADGALGIMHGVKFSMASEMSTCDGCAAGKAHSAPILQIRSSSRRKKILNFLHTDVCGLVEVSSLESACYFAISIDEHSNRVTLYPIKQKSDAADRFVLYQKYAERQTGRKICSLQSDSGGEYLIMKLSSHLWECEIKHRLYATYTLEQNAVVARMSRTLVSLACSMLHNESLSKSLWAEALVTAVYVRSWVTSKVLLQDITLHHIWKDRVLSLSLVKYSGCACWYALPKQKLRKLDQCSKAVIFIGYSIRNKVHKLLELETCKAIASRYVLFDENKFAELVLQRMPTIIFDVNDSEPVIEIRAEKNMENGTPDPELRHTLAQKRAL